MENLTRYTKILATLGPALETEEQIDSLIEAGVDAVRLNFSHGTHDWHKMVHQRVRRAAKRAVRAIAIVQDLQGPKIRLGEIQGNAIEVFPGSALIITSDLVLGTPGRISTTYPSLPKEVASGSKILIDDGRIQLEVERVINADIHCRVLVGGLISSRKGIHAPGTRLNAPSLTDKDLADVEFGFSLEVDYIALSFVRGAEDIKTLRDWITSKGKKIPIIAKIETSEALENLKEIIEASDGVMVARGDLGVEVSLEMIPFYQKQIIHSANASGKLVITATQMLESMVANPYPTRAEVSDIANSILDGTDVVMLSAETAIGHFPVDAVKQMASIAVTTERTLYPFVRTRKNELMSGNAAFVEVSVQLIAHATRELKPQAVVVFTRTGRTATLVSGERIRVPIFAFTPDSATFQRMTLLWGVVPRVISELQHADGMMREVTQQLVHEGLVTSVDTILFLFGTNTSPGEMNMIRIACASDCASQALSKDNKYNSSAGGPSTTSNRSPKE